MKKIWLIMLFVLTTCVCTFLIGFSVKAEEEVVEPEPEVIEPVTEPELNEEGFKEAVTNWMDQYLEEDLVIKIISWLVDAGVLSAMFAVWVKYRKFKDTTLEDLVNMTKAEIGKYLTENFEKLSEKEITEIKDTINNLEKSNETMMKVLILAQDKSTEGRIALIDFLGAKTEAEEVKETINEVHEKLEEEKKTEEEVKEKVADKYDSIF